MKSGRGELGGCFILFYLILFQVSGEEVGMDMERLATSDWRERVG